MRACVRACVRACLAVARAEANTRARTHTLSLSLSLSVTHTQILLKVTPLAEKFGWGGGDHSDDDGVVYGDEDASNTGAKGQLDILGRDIREISDRFQARQRPEVSFNKVMGMLYVTTKLNPQLYLPNRMFAAAWGIDFDLPIHLELKFSEVRHN